MLQGKSRDFAKRLLVLSRIKFVFDRITQSRYTTLYFFISLVSCFLLCAFHGVLFSDNARAVDILTDVVEGAQVPPHIAIVSQGQLWVCDGIPDKSDTKCMSLRSSAERDDFSIVQRTVLPRDEDEDEDDSDDEDDNTTTAPFTPIFVPSTATFLPAPTTTSPISTTASDVITAAPEPSSTDSTRSKEDKTRTSKSGTTTGQPTTTSTSSIPRASDTVLNQSSGSSNSLACIYSLSWLEETLHDSEREDAATLFFQIWVFTLGLAAILSESLPHLGAAFAGNILGAAWATSRIKSTNSLASYYRTKTVPELCEGIDVLGTWWETRLAHTIPVVVLNVFSLLALGFLTWKIFKDYSERSFSRVGANSAVNTMHRIVLFFSVGLQLASFFTAVSTGLWIAKVTHGNYGVFAEHGSVYLAAFIVVLVAEAPWLLLGWMCVRRECKIRFSLFLIIGALLISFSGVMFSSTMYRSIFKSWTFFATMTVTAFVFLVLTMLLGCICYFNFGKGLAHYLQGSEKLEGEDFAPVSIARHGGEKSLESQTIDQYAEEKYDGEWGRLQQQQQQPEPTYQFTLGRRSRGSSIFSDNLKSPIIISATPPLVSAINSAPSQRSTALTFPTITLSNRESPAHFAEVYNKYNAESWSIRRSTATGASGLDNGAAWRPPPPLPPLPPPPAMMSPIAQSRMSDSGYSSVSSFQARTGGSTTPQSSARQSVSSSFTDGEINRMKRRAEAAQKLERMPPGRLLGSPFAEGL